MSPVASSTDEHSVAHLSSSNAAAGASKKSPSGRLTSPAAYVFAPSWMSNSKESNKSSNLAFSSFSATGSPTAMSPQQRVIQGKYHNPAPRSSNSSPYPGCPSHKLSSNKSAHHGNATSTTTAANTATLPALHAITTTSTVKTPTSLHRSNPSNASSTSSSLQDSEFPTLVEETIPDKRHDGGRSAWGNPNAIKSKVFCPPTTETDENNEEMALSPYDIELERLKALVPKRNSGSLISTSSATVTTSKRNAHHHHHYHNHNNNNSNNNNSHNNNTNNNNNSNNNSHHHHHPPSPLVSPTPSRSLSSSHRMRFNNNSKSSRTTYNINNGYNYPNNNGNNGINVNNSNMRTSPLTKVPLQISSRESSTATSAVVKLPTTTTTTTTSSSITSSIPKRASSSGSSISSSASQPTSVCDQRLEPPPYRICELTDDTTTTSTSSFLESPRTLMEEDMMEEVIIEDDDEGEDKKKDMIEVHRVNDYEREHFLSWVRTWACRPGVKASSTTMKAINPRFFGSCGEYSYFGPLGTSATTISK